MHVYVFYQTEVMHFLVVQTLDTSASYASICTSSNP
jgi:hypothetical protein